MDWSGDGAPVCRCSCPSRQFLCKHVLGLLFEILAGQPFQTAELPQDMAEKRARQAARAARRETAAPKARKSNAAAQKKKLAKDLGSCYLTGHQTALTRIALTVRTVQSAPDQAEAAYGEALRIFVALHAVIRKSRPFLEEKLDSGNFSAEDSVLFEALGGRLAAEGLRRDGGGSAGHCRRRQPPLRRRCRPADRRHGHPLLLLRPGEAAHTAGAGPQGPEPGGAGPSEELTAAGMGRKNMAQAALSEISWKRDTGEAKPPLLYLFSTN